LNPKGAGFNNGCDEATWGYEIDGGRAGLCSRYEENVGVFAPEGLQLSWSDRSLFGLCFGHSFSSVCCPRRSSKQSPDCVFAGMRVTSTFGHIEMRWRSKRRRNAIFGLAFRGALSNKNLLTCIGGWIFRRELPKGGGDEGIDIVLVREGKRTIVQCKQHCKPVGPAIVREVNGAMIASRSKPALLACTSGFTNGVYRFVKDKPIELIDVQSIVRMQETANS